MKLKIVIEIFLSGISKTDLIRYELEQEDIQLLEDIVNYIADLLELTGTSLAAQSLNDRKKSRYFQNDRISLSLT